MIFGLVSPGSSQTHYIRRITLKRFHMAQRFLYTCQSVKVASSSTIWLQVDFLSPFLSPFPSPEYWLGPVSAAFVWLLTESNNFNFVKTLTWNSLRQDYVSSLRLKGFSTSSHAFSLYWPSKLVWIACISSLPRNIFYTTSVTGETRN